MPGGSLHHHGAGRRRIAADVVEAKNCLDRLRLCNGH
jgi:hypothetical protein